MIYLQDSDFTLYNGDALEVLRTLPDESVHMCVTSPPFFGLRDYQTGRWQGGDAECDHIAAPHSSMRPERSRATNDTFHGSMSTDHSASAGTPFRDTCGKCGATRIDRQIGLEETPEQYVQKLVEVFREVRRVLRRDGTLWLEVGDSYAAGKTGRADEDTIRAIDAASGRRPNALGYPANDAGGIIQRRPAPGLKPKDLIGAPWLLAFALRADGWYLRSDIVWSRPNPMPESVTDRPTKSHSYVFLLSKSARYFFDQEAVREPNSPLTLEVHGRYDQDSTRHKHGDEFGHKGSLGVNGRDREISGRNIRSVWNIATQPYPEAHFATYPEELVRRCILAGTSERGSCPECGAPWVREVEREREYDHVTTQAGKSKDGPYAVQTGDGEGTHDVRHGVFSRTTTLGWHPSCKCATVESSRTREASGPEVQGGIVGTFGDPVIPAGQPIPCTVLDPFSGSGTTALVARKHGRKCIGIELSADYCELSARRLQQLSLLSEAT